jgi:hypothetical protein
MSGCSFTRVSSGPAGQGPTEERQMGTGTENDCCAIPISFSNRRRVLQHPSSLVLEILILSLLCRQNVKKADMQRRLKQPKRGEAQRRRRKEDRMKGEIERWELESGSATARRLRGR